VLQKTDTQDIRGPKTLWDWLQLLIIPIVVAVGGFLFTQSLNERQQKNEQLRSQDASLQGYIDAMEELLLDRNLGTARSDAEVSSLARARTLTVLNELEPSDPRALVARTVEHEDQPGPPGTSEASWFRSRASEAGADRRQSVILFLYELD